MSNQKLLTSDLLLVNRTSLSYQSTYGDLKENTLDSHIIHSPLPPTEGDIVVGTIWVDTSTDPPQISVWDGSTWGEIQGGAEIVDPDRTEDVSFLPGVSGNGTQLSPYILTTVTSPTAGGTVVSEETIYIINQPVNTAFAIENLSNDSRFTQPFGRTDGNGDWSGTLTYTDSPNTIEGQTYEGLFNIGSECYIKWNVVQVANKTPIVGGDGSTSAPNASPGDVDIDGVENLYGTGTGVWADNDGTLAVTAAKTRGAIDNAIVFGVNGGVINDASKPITVGQKIEVQFDAARVNAAAEGDTITGALTNNDGFFQEFSMVKSTTASVFTINALVDQELSAVVETGIGAVAGVNAPSQLVLESGATLTSVEASVAGGAFASLPVDFNPGDTLQLRGTTGGDNGQEYTATVSVGSTQATWSVTTTDVAASIPQPQIVSPVDGATDVVLPVTIGSDAYQDNGTGAGPHTSSTWEVYESLAADVPKTSAATNVAETIVDGAWKAGTGTGGVSKYGVTYGNGKWVIVGSPQVVKTSDDAKTWTNAPTFPKNDKNRWYGVTHGNGVFVAVSASASKGTEQMFSDNGTSWQAAATSVFGDWMSVAHGNGKFVTLAAASAKRAAYSADGNNWTEATVPDNYWKKVTFGNGKFVAVAQSGTKRAITSTDGVSWSASVTADDTCNWQGVTYGDGKYVAVGKSGTIGAMYSTDGVNWTGAPSAPNNFDWYAVAYGDGRFVAMGDKVIMYSENGIDWELVPEDETPIDITWYDVHYADGKFVAISSNSSKEPHYSTTGTGAVNLVELTFADNKVYANSTGDEVEGATIDGSFKAGDKVIGDSDVVVFADSPAFSATVYTGDGLLSHLVPTGIDNTTKALVWVKDRVKAGRYNVLTHTGAGFDSRGDFLTLCSNTSAKLTESPYAIRSFENNGFTVGANGITNGSDVGDDNLVAWNFRGAPGFFDVVTYEGNGISQQVPHSLGSSPGVIITKATDEAQDWVVYHKELGNTKYIRLNEDAASLDNSDTWNSTSPSSTDFTLGSHTKVNRSGKNYVAYLFADTPGLIKCGKYDGDGGTKTESCGFKPGWVLIKRATGTGDWVILDSERVEGTPPSPGGVTGYNKELYPNEDYQESYGADGKIEDTGFSVTGTWNAAGQEYVYVAIAENASAGEFMPTGVLTEDADKDGPSMTLTNVTGTWVDGLKVVNESREVSFPSPPDSPGASYTKVVDAVDDTSNLTSYELTDSAAQTGKMYHSRVKYKDNAGVESEFSPFSSFTTGASTLFSTTLYTGNNSTPRLISTGIDNTNKSLIWIKGRGGTGFQDTRNGHFWFDSERNNYGEYLLSHDDSAQSDTPDGTIVPESNGFTIGGYNGNFNNPDTDFVAWNFAAAPGFFDVVTYTGTGAPLTVPHSLGSAPGLMIVKQTSGSGDWYVYSSVVPFNFSKYLKLNTTDALNKSHDDTIWDGELAEDTYFTVGSSSLTNADSQEYVAYLFADNPDGGIKCGSYTGVGGGNLNTVSCGFQPGWLLIKKDGVDDWVIMDNKRGQQALYPNDNGTGEIFSPGFTFTSDGFTIDESSGNVNATNVTYIYVAIADPG